MRFQPQRCFSCCFPLNGIRLNQVCPILFRISDFNVSFLEGMAPAVDAPICVKVTYPDGEVDERLTHQQLPTSQFALSVVDMVSGFASSTAPNLACCLCSVLVWVSPSPPLTRVACTTQCQGQPPLLCGRTVADHVDL